MHYTNFEIENYRGIKFLTLDLEAEPNTKILTLVGLNESGKTSILQAINSLFQELPADKCHTLIPKSSKANFNGRVTVTAHVALDDGDFEKIQKCLALPPIRFDLTYKFQRFIVQRVLTFKNSRYINSWLNWDIRLVGRRHGAGKIARIPSGRAPYTRAVQYIRDNLLPPIYYYENFLFEFPEQIYLEYHPNESGEQDQYRNIVRDILATIDEEHSLEVHILSRAKSTKQQDRDALDAILLQIAGKVTETVLEPWNDLFVSHDSQTRHRQIVVRSALDPSETRPGYYLEFILQEGYENYQIAERSLGFKWFFAFLLFTEFRKARASKKGDVLFLLDEPASNLHSTAQAKLLDTFGRLVDGSQLIYATHSQHLISPDWLEGAYIVQNKSLNYKDMIDFQSSMTDIDLIPYKKFVYNHPDQTTYFQPILDALEFKPSRLEMVESIVVCEGKNDFYTYKYLDEVVFQDEFALHFCPGNGASGNIRVIQLYLAWGRDFLVLLDADRAGKRAKEMYLDKFGKLVSERIFTLSDIDEDWEECTAESLFSLDDQLKVMRSFDSEASKFSKRKFNAAIQQLLFFKRPLDLDSRTRRRFRTVLEFLQGRLGTQ